MVIEQLGLKNIPKHTCREVQRLVMPFKTFSFKQQRSRIFWLKDHNTEDSNHVLSNINICLQRGNIMHGSDVVTRFHNGGFINKIGAYSTWNSFVDSG